MEDVMDSPHFGKIDLICDMGYFGGYLKRSILPW